MNPINVKNKIIPKPAILYKMLKKLFLLPFFLAIFIGFNNYVGVGILYSNSSLSSASSLHTGQKTCFDITAPSDVIKLIDCSSSNAGGDAKYDGVEKSFSFVNDSLNILRDNHIGLMWTSATPDLITKTEAVAYCDNLNSGGYTDWRMPNILELRTALGSSDTISGNPSPNGNFWPSGENFDYWPTKGIWTSTIDNNGKNLTLHLIDESYLRRGGQGLIRQSPGSVKAYGVCVRGMAYGITLNDGLTSNKKFIDNGDGSILDLDTNFFWQKNDSGKYLTWTAGALYCSNLALCNDGTYDGNQSISGTCLEKGGIKYDDWRLPTAIEGATLIDYGIKGYKNPAFDDMHRVYWTSTSLPSRNSIAYDILTVEGAISNDAKKHGGSEHNIRAKCMRVNNVSNSCNNYTPLKLGGAGNGFVKANNLVGIPAGSGDFSLSWGDYDGDGDSDLLVSSGDRINLYKNNGDGTFTDIAASVGINSVGIFAVFTDINNDGLLDIFQKTGPHFEYTLRTVYTNTGQGFTKQTFNLGAADWGNNTVDANGDGYLDIFYGNWTGGWAQLLKNNKSGNYVPATNAEFPPIYQDTFGARWADYNNDGYPDVYIPRAYDTAGAKHMLYKNNGNGAYTNVIDAAGMSANWWHSASAAWGDYDKDGDLDLFVGNAYQQNRLLRNNGNGTFTDVSNIAGISTQTNYVVSAHFIDLNADGHLDIVVSHNILHSKVPIHYYKNNGNGTFTLDTSLPGTSGSIAFSDYDQDGDMDYVMGGVDFYINLANPAPGTYLRYTVKDQNGVRNQYGATVKLFEAGTNNFVGMQVIDGGTFKVQNDYTLVFNGLNPRSLYDVHVHKTDGTMYIDANIAPDCSDSDCLPVQGNSRDIYDVVKIGDQCWFRDNMRDVPRAGSGYYVQPNGIAGLAADQNTVDDHIYSSKYTENVGLLYDIEGAENVCPSGFKLPTDNDWKELEAYLGMTEPDLSAHNTNRTSGDVANKLKKDGSSGFNLLFGGYANINNGVNHFGPFYSCEGNSSCQAYFWSAANPYTHRWTSGALSGFPRWDHDQGGTMTDRYSVRCIQSDAEAVCGNSIVEDGEECDDGNTEDGDGCSRECLFEPLGVYCLANPNPALKDANVTWTAFPNGGFEPYSYSWSGTDGLSGNEITTSKTYNSTGIKTASVTVTAYNGSSTIAYCSDTVYDSECNDGIDNDGDGLTDGDDPQCADGGIYEAPSITKQDLILRCQQDSSNFSKILKRNESMFVKWTANNANSCQLIVNGQINLNLATSSSQTFSNIQNTQNIELRCIGANNSVASTTDRCIINPNVNEI